MLLLISNYESETFINKFFSLLIMELESKIKQSLALLTVAAGIGLFAKYSGIDSLIMPDKNDKETTITYEQDTTKKYEGIITQKDTEQNIRNKDLTKEKNKVENKPSESLKKKQTTIEQILEEETKDHTDYTKYNSSKYSSKNNSTTKDFTNIGSYKNQSNSGKKVFVYHQNLSSDEMMKEAMEVCDYWMPHFYEIKQEKEVIKLKKGKTKTITKTVFEKRASEKKLESIMQEAYKNTQNIMPMISAFEKKSVMNVLNNPNDYAKKIHEEIRKIKANGVSIDLESIDVGREESEKLVRFMKTLRKEMPGYIITIAVSPRFEGSAENGFKHHAFYNYKELANYADYLNIMFYDFHKDKVGPIAPAHMNDKVAEYALKNIPPEKIVMLYPLYGGVWEHKWKKNKEIIKPVGPLSSNRVDTFTRNRDVLYRYYEDGELIIKTKDRTAYVQDGTTFYNRTKRMDKFGLKNIGGWKQNHGTKDIYNQIKYWKQRK
jgi:spore germination protein YaaH